METACRIYWKYRKEYNKIENINRFKVAFLTSLAITKVQPLKNNKSLNSSNEQLKKVNVEFSIYLASQILKNLCGNRSRLNHSGINTI